MSDAGPDGPEKPKGWHPSELLIAWLGMLGMTAILVLVATGVLHP